MPKELPFAPATERNKAPILEAIRQIFATPQKVLEIGSGTGQHAVYFAQQLPHIQWYATETAGNLAHLAPRMDAAGLPNLHGPLRLDASTPPWPVSAADAAYAANVAHIMSWQEVTAMFAGVGEILAAGGAFCLYGPFNYDGEFTSDSNARFDAQLRARAAHMGLRDLEDLVALATDAGMALEADHAMPANNRLLVWRKID